MNHRHLLPNEIDLLVDGDAGFGVAPLRGHLKECAQCAERFEEALFVAQALEELPHFAPDSRLADRVMAEVPVFVPAHVAARDTVTRWMPQSARARAAAGALITTMAGALTLGMIWLTTQGETVVFIIGLLGDRLRDVVLVAARDLAVALLGESALDALRATGTIGASLLIGGLGLAAFGTVIGIRRLASAGRR